MQPPPSGAAPFVVPTLPRPGVLRLAGQALLLAIVARTSPAAAAAPAPRDPPRPPNVVIIYADDLGYGDLGCYGHPSIRTPHLDRMAAEGMRFTDFYSAAEVCTPSRAALLTGRYPVRSGMAHDEFRVLRAISTGHLPADEVTLAELLKTRGYHTAMIGKWHLGEWQNDPAGHPDRHGFDETFGLPHSNDMNAMPQRPKAAGMRADQQPGWWNAPLFRNRELIEQPADQTTLTRRYTEEAVRFIHEHRAEPFFLYLPHTFPHTPLFASADFRGQSRRGLYGDVVEELDWSVGQVLAALRDGKGSTWEGGMRVPGIAWWPGRIAAGTVQREMASTLDLFPTVAALAGAALPADRPIDGLDIRPLLFGTGPVHREAFFYYRGTRLFAARRGDFKAHFRTQDAYGAPRHVDHDPPLLYHLGIDPGESHDVAGEHSDVIRDIAAAVAAHTKTVVPVASQLVETVPPAAAAGR